MTIRMIQLRSMGLVLVWAAFTSPAGAAPEPAAEQIRQLEWDVNAAYAANELPTYFVFYADDLMALFPEGLTNLPEYKSYWTAFIRSGGSIVSFKCSNLNIKVGPSSDSAVASYQASVSIRDPAKGMAQESYNETDVWFKRANTWKIVEIHLSKNEQK